MPVQLSEKLSPRQLQLLQAAAPTADDILENMDYLEELNEEIVQTYSLPPVKAVEEPTRRKEPAVSKQIVRPQRPVVELDPEAELDEMNRQSELLIAKRKAEVAAETQAPEPEVEQNPEEMLRGQILGALTGHKQAPTENDIAKWKREYGENAVYVTALNEDDVFVFTYLRRGQWQKIQQAVANAQKADLASDPENLLKEKVLQFTILWPRPLTIEFFGNSRAGTIDTLFNVIMANSSFLQLNQAMILTTQL